MKLYLFNRNTYEIAEYTGLRPLKFDGETDLIFKKGPNIEANYGSPEQNSDGMKNGIKIYKSNLDYTAYLTTKELDLLVKICGIKNIRSQKVKIFTPELFVRYMQQKNPNEIVFLKLGEDCISCENNLVKTVHLMDPENNRFLKYMNKKNEFALEVSFG